MTCPKSLAVTFGLLLTVAGGSAFALSYDNGYFPNEEYRFYVGADRAFFAEGYDLSGVAVDMDELDGRAYAGGPCATMISPSYFVTSSHYSVGPGTPLVFAETNDPAAPKHVYYVADSQYMTHIGGSDLVVGRLTEPLRPQDHITYYPLASFASSSDYLNKPVLVYGNNDQLGDGTLNSITGTPPAQTLIHWTTNSEVSGPSHNVNVISGDSSHPTFIPVNGQLALVGLHYLAGNYDQALGYPSQILAAMGTEFYRTMDAAGNLSAAPTPSPALPLPQTAPFTEPSYVALTYSGLVLRYDQHTLQKTAQVDLAYCLNQINPCITSVGGMMFVVGSTGTSGYGSRILRYGLDGAPMPAGGHSGATFTTVGDMAGMNELGGWIRNLAPGEDGFLYAATNSGVWRFDPQTAATTKLVSTADNVVAVALGPDVSGDGKEDLYVATGNGIGIYDVVSGAYISAALAPGTVTDLRDFAISQGRIIATSGYSGDDRLHVYDAATGAPVDVGYGPGLLNPYVLNHAEALDVGPSGEVYVSETWRNIVWQVNPLTGALTQAVNTAGQSPLAIAYMDIPEPATAAILCLGAILLARRRVR